MTEFFHCGGCGKNYDTEKEVSECSALHAKARQEQNQQIAEDQREQNKGYK